TSQASRSAPGSLASCCARPRRGLAPRLLRQREERQVVRQVDFPELGELVSPACRLREGGLLRSRKPDWEVLLAGLTDQRAAERRAHAAERKRSERLRRAERPHLDATQR